MDVLKVATDELNLRREPRQVPTNVIVALPLGHDVTVVSGPPGEKWWEVETEVDGEAKRGFVSSAFLRKPATEPREKLIAEAMKQFLRFKRGAGREDIVPFSDMVGEFWQALGISLTGKNREQPWSAAYISFITRRAGYQRFPFAEAHATYINDAIKKRETGKDADYWGFRLNEHRPALGDLVAGWRGKKVTFDTRPAGFFASHTDVVVEVRATSIRTLGGNVGNSVKMKTFALDAGGFLKPQGSLFAILRNNN
ncbi:MAG TPA: DUF2272 domain-containing protein [Longimicrobium sp.]|jgi:hypothetical protein|nr:DUF2272 domain-containing protein [Longimicrobium sp.]